MDSGQKRVNESSDLDIQVNEGEKGLGVEHCTAKGLGIAGHGLLQSNSKTNQGLGTGNEPWVQWPADPVHSYLS